MQTATPQANAEQLFARGRNRAQAKARGRERAVEQVAGGAFVVVALAMAIYLSSPRALDLGTR
jgi:hypothetical protein